MKTYIVQLIFIQSINLSVTKLIKVIIKLS